MMLDFFRQPSFWGMFALSGVGMVIAGIGWASGLGRRRQVAMLFLGIAIALTVIAGFEHGILAPVAVGVTGLILGSIGLEIGADRAPSHAVVLDTADALPAVEEIKLAS
jgi:hypothetical protein